LAGGQQLAGAVEEGGEGIGMFAGFAEAVVDCAARLLGVVEEALVNAATESRL